MRCRFPDYTDQVRSLSVAALSLILALSGNIRETLNKQSAMPTALVSITADLPVVDVVRLVTPQQEVEIRKGRHLNLLCLGSGTPTVIFDSGTGGGVYDWRFVQAAIALDTRACAYDRAGFGFSDPSGRISDANDAADDLQQLILKAGIPLPVILVAHSNGGIYAVKFAQLHRREVAGMVLVDPGFTGQQNFAAYGLLSSRAAELEAGNAEWIRLATRCLALANAHALDGLVSSPCLDDPSNQNLTLHQALDSIQSTPAYEAALLSEFESTFGKRNGTTLNDQEVPLKPFSLSPMPITVLTASRHPATPADFSSEDQAKYYAFWNMGHDRLAALSDCGQNIVVPNTSHFIQYDEPRVVVSSIRAVLNRLRASHQNKCIGDLSRAQD